MASGYPGMVHEKVAHANMNNGQGLILSWVMSTV